VPFTLHVDQRSPALAKLFRDTGNTRASFLTADNPFSVPASERANRFKHALLRLLLPESLLATTAVDPTGRWPDERGFLVMGWSMRSAIPLGRMLCIGSQTGEHKGKEKGQRVRLARA
jgi:Protein of unknown function (DUF3293)